jgi:multiple sugar transport system ATP-binding protein
MIYVTHDQIEAMTMADKIVVLNAGNIEQVGSPMELYKTPKNLFVAGFIGSPRMNLIEGEAAARQGAATIGIRPEHMALSTSAGEWKATVGVAEHLGSDTFLHVQTEGIGLMTARVGGEFGIGHGDRVWLTPRPECIHRFDSEGRAIR